MTLTPKQRREVKQRITYKLDVLCADQLWYWQDGAKVAEARRLLRVAISAVRADGRSVQHLGRSWTPLEAFSQTARSFATHLRDSSDVPPEIFKRADKLARSLRELERQESKRRATKEPKR